MFSMADPISIKHILIYMLNFYPSIVRLRHKENIQPIVK